MDFINALKNEQNFTYTENGAGTYTSTLSGVLDLFGLGGAYRSRSDKDCCHLFAKAYNEDKLLALKCLFYLRDVRGGQGERRFFRVVLHDLAMSNPDLIRKNLENIPEFGRWDDLYCLVGTDVEKDAFALIKKQLQLDMSCKTPSLLAKWLKSENTSSKESRRLAAKTRAALGLTSRQYRKMLSKLRAQINVLERLMSANRWNEIEFDKIPSRAGFIYKNAFARRDIIKAHYEAFMKDKNTKVNAKTLYPYEVIHDYWTKCGYYRQLNSLDRATLDKYWDNLTDYINGAELNALAMVDTSGSMSGTPLEVAVSLGMICAERCSGPYHNHFMTFSSKPQLQELIGEDFCEKVKNMLNSDWQMNTNIEAAFDLLLSVAVGNNLSQNDIPKSLIIISDMEFDSCATTSSYNTRYEHWYGTVDKTPNMRLLMSQMEKRWAQFGYKLPSLYFWNVSARNDRVPMQVRDGVTYVSGFSPVLFDQIIKNKTAWDLVLDKLLSDRYKSITL